MRSRGLVIVACLAVLLPTLLFLVFLDAHLNALSHDAEASALSTSVAAAPGALAADDQPPGSLPPAPLMPMVVAGNLAVVGEGSRLTVLDLTNKAAPSVLGSLALAQPVMAVALSGDFAYVAADDLLIVDVSTPSQPRQVGAFDGPAPIWDVAVSGGHAYVTDGALRVINVTTPSQPHQVGAYAPLNTFILDLKLTGGMAYVGAYDAAIQSEPGLGKLLAVNVGNPAQPSGGQVISPLPELWLDRPEKTWRFDVVGQYAYVARGVDGLRILDISNLAKPVEVGYYTPSYHIWQVVISNYHAYVQGFENTDALYALNITHPTRPTGVSRLDTISGLRLLGLVAADGFLYLGHYDGLVGRVASIRVVEASSPADLRPAALYRPTFPQAPPFLPLKTSPHREDSLDQTLEPQVFLPTLSQHAWAAPPRFEPLGGLGWPLRAVAMRGIFAYVGDGPFFRIYDMRAPYTPRLLGSLLLPAEAERMVIAERYAYILIAGDVLVIIDIANPNTPRQVGRLSSVTTTRTFSLRGRYLLTDRFPIDVSNPAAPRAASAHSFTPCEIRLAGDLAVWGTWRVVSSHQVEVCDNRGDCRLVTRYVADGDLHLMDVADPATPQAFGVIQSYQTGHEFETPNPGCFTLPLAIDRWGPALYLGQAIWDIAHPASLRQVGQLPQPVDALYIGGNRAYLTSGSQFYFLDMSNPFSLTVIAHAPIPGSAIGIVGDYVFTKRDDALRVIDVSDLSQLRWTKVLPATPLNPVARSGYPSPVKQVSGRHDYFAGLVIDATQPMAPRSIGRVGVNDTIMEASRSYIYSLDDFGGLTILDAFNPAFPRRVFSAGLLRHMSPLAVAGNLLYAHTMLDGLKVYDIADPRRVALIGQGSAGGSSLVPDGDYLYAIIFGSRLHVIDVSDPTAPQSVTTLDLPVDGANFSMSAGAALVGHLLLVESRSRMNIVDVSDPTTPQVVGQYVTPTRAVAGQGHYAYVGTLTGIDVVDISRPEQPVRIDSFATNTPVTALRTHRQYLYAQLGERGWFLVFPLR